MAHVSISHTVRTYPTFPYDTIKNTILGTSYQLSLTFIGATRAQKLNQTYRQKVYVPNVLSFPLTDTAGEIYICPQVAKRQAKKFDPSVDGYMAFLFIHGCVHLKGHDHGDTMERLEQRYLKKFHIS